MSSQSALFDEPAALPNGLALVPAFLTPREERMLLEAIRGLELREAQYKQYTARRRIASFGAQYDFDANELRPAPGLPPFLEPLRARVGEWLGIAADEFTHALVSEYRPGTPLGWHRDVPEFEVIVGVSLAADARMRFRPWPPKKGDAVLALDLPPRSAYVLRGEVRWRWQHSVAATKALRYSITFRTRAKAG
ncbi:MAG TPA: alpha-ketoglutarate-dependent dioxygenase AlkB [Usitatibacter sp.]|nr:alpha-ketoglutarate-dependent dioxygenase AlkB [Usitatibacter sp.]